MSVGDFHFLRPFWFIALLPLGVLLWSLARRKLHDKGWKLVCDPALVPHILIRQSTQRRSLALYALSLGGILVITALAGPTWERLPEPVFRDQSALVIVMDLSRSMDATDVKPSRLIRARYKVADILKRRKEGLTAFVVYAGDAFTVTPMTDDTATIATQLPVLSTDLMPAQGNRLDLGLAEASKLLRQSGYTRGDILVISDEVKGAAAVDAVHKLVEQGYRLSIMGVGTLEGSPVPLKNGGLLRDTEDNIVITRLHEAPLKDLTAIGEGIYTRLRLDDQDVQALQALHGVDRLHNRKKDTSLKADIWREEGPWLLLAVLPLAALAFRRGYLIVLAVVLLPVPRPVLAIDWTGLWLRADQQASRALAAGEAEKAAQTFHDPAWKAAAWYRAGEYEKALSVLEGVDGNKGLYNRGNALARLGRLPEAIAAYEEVLKRDPHHEDARYNRDLLEKELQRQRQEQRSQPQTDNQESQRQNQGSQPQIGQQQNSPPTENRQESSNRAQRNDDAQEAHAGQAQEPQSVPLKGKAAGPHDGESQNSKPPAVIPRSKDESELATEQWLRRIPDDPGGLLRRKFRYLHQQRSRSANPDLEPW